MLRPLSFSFVALAAPPPPVTALAYHPSSKFLLAGTRGDVAVIDANNEVIARLGG